jgi:hypothetical protein
MGIRFFGGNPIADPALLDVGRKGASVGLAAGTTVGALWPIEWPYHVSATPARAFLKITLVR